MARNALYSVQEVLADMSEKCGAWGAGVLVLLSIGAMLGAAILVGVAYIGDSTPNPWPGHHR